MKNAGKCRRFSLARRGFHASCANANANANANAHAHDMDHDGGCGMPLRYLLSAIAFRLAKLESPDNPLLEFPQ